MKPFVKGAWLGAGLVSLGYGAYRIGSGKRDWFASTAVTTGLSMTLGSLSRNEAVTTPERLHRLMDQVDFAIPMAVMRALR